MTEYAALQKFSLHCLAWIWRHLPLPFFLKGKIKTWLLKQPLLLQWTRIQTEVDKAIAISLPAILKEKNSLPDGHVPRLDAKPIANKPAKLICFYLPQFHPIPENNRWWGEGFTEWTNVLPAQPQFVGHYQPHLPDDFLGCYSLLDKQTQHKQIELAKAYGIEGFCFYFYWFGGKRLLETPLQHYLHDKSLDLPFCLCWANENWTRRWDGMDQEILMAQQHSPEDDLAFIRYVAQYMRDDRYIRIGGKPLLLVYRPSLLPAARKTVKRWRTWCRQNGIGEIYLAYTQSFDFVNPKQYGFDAAIEFPPANRIQLDITQSVTPTRADFAGSVYDWRIFVGRSEQYRKKGYPLFRGVCPSWDNTARRKNHGKIFLHSSPALYQRWLENAIRDTLKNQDNPDERLIFINAWNEWAEGAHLEPDQKYGYAWLQATRNALLATTTRSAP
jgi:lipopolysaccharide biosynthesis protein